MKRLLPVLLAAAVALALVGCSTLDDPPSESGSSSVRGTPTAVRETPTPVPTADVIGMAKMTATDAESYLKAEDLTARFRTSAGEPVTDLTGWIVTAQDVAAGAGVTVGYRITLTVAKPQPVVQKPQPKPKPKPIVKPKPKPIPKPIVKPKPRPQPVQPGGGATAKCRDGSLSYSAHHQGTCSHHGGVAVWYK
jgi:outer membrane biosynthesis protein TonB